MSVAITDEFEVQGEEVRLADAEKLKQVGAALIDASEGPLHVDMSDLVRANSVTVALLLSWYRYARSQDKSIMFVNLSEELHNIIEFSGLTRVLLHRSPGM